MIYEAPVDLQIAITSGGWPAEPEIREVATLAISAVFDETGAPNSSGSELSLLFTDDRQIREINDRWRGIDKPTNVLSFPAVRSINPRDPPPVIGDVVFARQTIMREAELENKPVNHHLVHLIVHGLLHLLGYDHQKEEEAEEMESLESLILARFAIPDPYGMICKND